MPRKPRTAKTTPTASPGPKARPGALDRVIDAALDEAAALGWRALTLAGVAARAGLEFGDVLVLTPTKHCLLARYLDRIDQQTLGPVRMPDPRDKPRDRLFEIIMRRFDVLNRHRAGSRAVIVGVARDPVAMALAGLRLRRALAAMLAASDIPADGLVGCLRIQGLKGVCLVTLRAWMNDDSSDMAKTMAALDRALGQAERLARFLPAGRRRAAEAASA
ncbi:MAG: hypothetical protein EPO08_06330 [Rhodospirillaceae bacterium]|nr:MAG: hypothetical protein EPO08_06330 [Rhodospirillaceae bacterium]